MNIKYFKIAGKPLTAHNVFLVDMSNLNKTWEGDYLSYAPIGQHSPCSPTYLRDTKKVEEITKAEYIKASAGYYTPGEYL